MTGAITGGPLTESDGIDVSIIGYADGSWRANGALKANGSGSVDGIDVLFPVIGDNIDG